jgi:hypothetical protein
LFVRHADSGSDPGTSARKKDLPSSSPMARSWLTLGDCCFACVSRAASALLSGSMVRANLILRRCIMPADFGVVRQIAQFHERAPHMPGVPSITRPQPIE